MKSVTVDEVMNWNPCRPYTREKVEELFDGRETVDAADVYSMDIEAGDRRWALKYMLDNNEWADFNEKPGYTARREYFLSLRINPLKDLQERVEKLEKQERVEKLEKLHKEQMFHTIYIDPSLEENEIRIGKTKFKLEPKKNTCGECIHPWLKEGANYDLICREVLDEKSARGFQWRLPSDKACPKFKLREELNE